MQKLFHYDSPLIKWLNRTGKIVILNMLWVLCCIPVLTIGASTTALYRVTMALAMQKDDASVARDFLHAFRTNFKPATFVWLILLFPALLIFVNLALFINGNLGTSLVGLCICLIPIPPLLFIFAYIFAYVATFEDMPLRAIANSAIISISNFPKTLAMVALNLSPFLVYFLSIELFLRLLFVWLLLAFALIAYLNSKLILKAFAPYLNSGKREDPGA